MSLSTMNSMSTPSAFHQLFRTFSADEMISMVHSAARVNGQAGAVKTKVTNHSVIAHLKKKAVSVAAPSKATRPLNSWIAFRSYYSTMFTSLQQKDISGFLTNLWQTDPFKAKWSILAKGYSLIRDSKGKVKAPLDSYLAINGPFIGIVPPEEYLKMLGWKIVAGDDGGRFLRRDFDIDVSSLDQDLLTSNVSVNDIIQHSYAAGYIEANDVNLIMPDNEPAMTMATLMQHNLPVQSAYSAAVNNGSSGASGPATVSSMVNANDALEQNLSGAVKEKAEKDGTGDEYKDMKLKGKSSDWKNDNAILLADRDATEDTSIFKDIDTDMVTPMGISGIVVTGAVMDDSGIVADTQTAPGPQDSTSPAIDTGEDWFSAAAKVPNPNPGESIFNTSFDVEKFGQYPFDDQFTPENISVDFDPFEGDDFNSYDISEYVDYSNYFFEG